MKIRTLAAYLVGSRRAILEVSEDRRAIGIGLLLVISATLAREYDTHDLRSEPWHLLTPLAASLLMSGLLFAMLYARMALGGGNRPPGLFDGYRTFLSLFWMTAPIAWLYAIPYERFLTDVGAAKANLYTLALVAVWRVLLISRVISVLVDCGSGMAFFAVMLVAEPAVVVAVASLPNDLLQMMGGLQLPERDQIILRATFNVQIASLFTLPFWLITGTIAFFLMPAHWEPSLSKDGVPARGWLLPFSVAAVVFWIPFLPRTQGEQRLRFKVESDLRAGHIESALATLSSHEANDFPPHWDPPPRAGYDDESDLILDVLEKILDNPPAPWVRKLYFGKLPHALKMYRMAALFGREKFMTETWTRAERLLGRISHEPELPAEIKDAVEEIRRLLAERSPTQPATAPATQPAPRV